MEKLSFDYEAGVYFKKWRVHVTLPSSLVYTFSQKRETDIYRVFAMTSINT